MCLLCFLVHLHGCFLQLPLHFFHLPLQLSIASSYTLNLVYLFPPLAQEVYLLLKPTVLLLGLLQTPLHVPQLIIQCLQLFVLFPHLSLQGCAILLHQLKLLLHSLKLHRLELFIFCIIVKLYFFELCHEALKIVEVDIAEDVQLYLLICFSIGHERFG